MPTPLASLHPGAAHAEPPREATGIRSVPIRRWHKATGAAPATDLVAAEEPLLIRVGGQNVAVVMRTPGQDRELAAGFLLSEGVIRGPDDLLDLLTCRELEAGEHRNVVEAVLAPHVAVDLARLTRHVFSASSCGVCGKTSIDAVFQHVAPIRTAHAFDLGRISELPRRLAADQPGFGATGGVHATALVAPAGEFIAVREDVGRHNAMDKVLGWALLENRLPLHDHALLVSGRVSFELVQKSAAAGIAVIAGIGAPSSLAIDCARRAGQTLIGFVRADRMNIYT